MISIVIPTHNRIHLLKRAIKSVLNQTYQEFEVIIVSDGSTDGTDLFVEKLMKKDNRIRYISYYPAKGGNTARNIGIEASKYEYIAFLDDDDKWYSNKLEKQASIFRENTDIGLIYTGVNSIYVNESINYIINPVENGDLSKKILLQNYIGTTSTVIIRKSVLEKSGWFDVNLGALQDYDLWIRICQYTNIEVITEPCIYYYNDSANCQISQYTKKYEQSIGYINRKYKLLISNLSFNERLVRQKNLYYLLANKSMRNGDKKGALLYSIKMIKKGISKKGLIMLFISFFNYSFILRIRRLVNLS